MDETEYFNQEKVYFSKSRNEYEPIEEMPFQQALFSHRKLYREYGRGYRGTHLYQAFIRKLCPGPEGIREQLERYGKACHVIFEPDVKATGIPTVRNKLYQAANKKVTTHLVSTRVGSYIEATVPVPMRQKVKA